VEVLSMWGASVTCCIKKYFESWCTEKKSPYWNKTSQLFTFSCFYYSLPTLLCKRHQCWPSRWVCCVCVCLSLFYLFNNL